VNVSELRELVMETRMIADITWDARTAFSGPNPADRFVDWWSREYFGPQAAGAADAYRQYYGLLDSYDKIWYGSMLVQQAVTALDAKFAGKPFERLTPETREALAQRDAKYRAAMDAIRRTSAAMREQERQFFYEHVTLGLLIDWRQTQAAAKLAQAVDETDLRQAWKHCLAAREDLEKLEVEILRAERPPFENWYRKTWIRSSESPSNVHRSYEVLRAFLAEHNDGM
jgi:hypothetical protein